MESTEGKKFKVAVLGGGISGAATFYTLAKYTDVGSICLVEKCPQLGQINSRGSNNSQTLHFGDIETNYSLEKARVTKAASEMVVAYLLSLGNDGRGIYEVSQKMALAVGEKEVAALAERHERFKELFPDSRLIGREEIAKLEPEIVNGRKADETLAACYTDKGYTVDFGKLAESLVNEGCKAGQMTELFLGAKVTNIKKTPSGYVITTDKARIEAEAVVVAMCSHSLMFAKSLGYGREFAILPVGGNFYTSNRQTLKGKVYTMQSGKLPFAAVHGDPNLGDSVHTRFGPTANIMPFLERNSLRTFTDFLSSSADSYSSLRALLKVVFEPTLFTFLCRSLVYELPYFGPRAFAKLAKKIIPGLTYADFKNGKTKAGIRPQLIDIQNRKLMMGEIGITGENIIFNITPSPGATSCLKNAAKNVEQIIGFFDGSHKFDKARLETDLSLSKN
ncbi:FAD-dependent oxidoreductase [Candidatus Falkowbacteria bacterium]|nr:FAD-dependent oxidoreductase [Candidatus Falkowbacteria bacterium]